MCQGLSIPEVFGELLESFEHASFLNHGPRLGFKHDDLSSRGRSVLDRNWACNPLVNIHQECRDTPQMSAAWPWWVQTNFASGALPKHTWAL